MVAGAGVVIRRQRVSVLSWLGEQDLAGRAARLGRLQDEAEDYVTEEYLEELHGEMLAAAANLEFERAAELRDRIARLKGQPTAAPQAKKPRRRKRS